MLLRIQLSLYVPLPAQAALELVRQRLDPVQASLIPAHVTLCREDELAGLEPAEIRSRLAAAEAQGLTLQFGSAELFDGHGVLLPCVGGEAEFQALRRWVLGSSLIRRQAPHITLAHPRNPKSPGNIAGNIAKIPSNVVIHFTSVCRVQQEGSKPWQVLDMYTLAGAKRRGGRIG